MGFTGKWKQPQVRTDLPVHAVQLRGRRRRARRRRRIPSRFKTFSGGDTPDTWPLVKRTGGGDDARRGVARALAKWREDDDVVTW
jgi:hypothetical protein